MHACIFKSYCTNLPTNDFLASGAPQSTDILYSSEYTWLSACLFHCRTDKGNFVPLCSWRDNEGNRYHCNLETIYPDTKHRSACDSTTVREDLVKRSYKSYRRGGKTNQRTFQLQRIETRQVREEALTLITVYHKLCCYGNIQTECVPV